MRLYKVLLVVALAAEGGGFVVQGTAGNYLVAGGAIVAAFGILFMPPRRRAADEPDPGPAVPDLRHFLKRFDEWCLVAPPLTTEVQEGRWIRLVGAVNLLRSGLAPAAADHAYAEEAPRLCEVCGAPVPWERMARGGAELDEQTAEVLRFALTGRCRSCAAKEGIRDARG